MRDDRERPMGQTAYLAALLALLAQAPPAAATVAPVTPAIENLAAIRAALLDQQGTTPDGLDEGTEVEQWPNYWRNWGNWGNWGGWWSPP